MADGFIPANAPVAATSGFIPADKPIAPTVAPEPTGRPATSIGPTSTGLPTLGSSKGPLGQYLEQAENLTPEGAKEHPVEQVIGQTSKRAKEFANILGTMGMLFVGPEGMPPTSVPKPFMSAADVKEAGIHAEGISPLGKVRGGALETPVAAEPKSMSVAGESYTSKVPTLNTEGLNPEEIATRQARVKELEKVGGRPPGGTPLIWGQPPVKPSALGAVEPAGPVAPKSPLTYEGATGLTNEEIKAKYNPAKPNSLTAAEGKQLKDAGIGYDKKTGAWFTRNPESGVFRIEGGKEPPRPDNTTEDHKWNPNGPQGAGWYKEGTPGYGSLSEEAKGALEAKHPEGSKEGGFARFGRTDKAGNPKPLSDIVDVVPSTQGTDTAGGAADTRRWENFNDAAKSSKAPTKPKSYWGYSDDPDPRLWHDMKIGRSRNAEHYDALWMTPQNAPAADPVEVIISDNKIVVKPHEASGNSGYSVQNTPAGAKDMVNYLENKVFPEVKASGKIQQDAYEAKGAAEEAIYDKERAAKDRERRQIKQMTPEQRQQLREFLDKLSPYKEEEE